MTTFARIGLSVFLLAFTGVDAARGATPGVRGDTPAVRGTTPATRVTPEPEFSRRIDAYVALHRRAAATLPARERTADASQLVDWRKALANAIRAARPNAKQGDIFTPEVEADLRKLTRGDIAARSPKERAAVRQEVPRLPFAVNDEYPSAAPLATVPPMLLAHLPRLPEEVEYRFFDRHLILHDVDANLIVDYIPNALPAEQ